jgi:anaerobic ribonucleoside-triphosphate reductase
MRVDSIYWWKPCRDCGADVEDQRDELCNGCRWSRDLESHRRQLEQLRQALRGGQ